VSPLNPVDITAKDPSDIIDLGAIPPLCFAPPESNYEM
jgi:hypothetical protein